MFQKNRLNFLLIHSIRSEEHLSQMTHFYQSHLYFKNIKRFGNESLNLNSDKNRSTFFVISQYLLLLKCPNRTSNLKRALLPNCPLIQPARLPYALLDGLRVSSSCLSKCEILAETAQLQMGFSFLLLLQSQLHDFNCDFLNMAIFFKKKTKNKKTMQVLMRKMMTIILGRSPRYIVTTEQISAVLTRFVRKSPSFATFLVITTVIEIF